ncbi:MAG TPA: ankyrin repeat domain-containing protein [Mucilaginibacter sp.]|jgi:ankyrin repeat protein|nr:ankyrin repeat domain-containing protein [Mucilaginibacter sp.]
MKFILILCLILSSILVFGQTKDEQLYDAAIKNDTLKVEALLNQVANPNVRLKRGAFELSILIWAAQHQYVKVAKLLVEHKAEVDWRDVWKETALLYASHTGNKAIVDILIAGGADPNAKDDQGSSVLDAAKESKNEEVIKLIESLQKK